MVERAKPRINVKGYALLIMALDTGARGVIELSEISGLWPSSVRNYIAALRAVTPKQVYIDSWESHHECPSVKFPKYRLGSEADARKPPALTKQEAQDRNTARKAEKRRRQKWGGLAPSNSIFNYAELIWGDTKK